MVSDSVNKSRQNITLAHFIVQNYVIKKNGHGNIKDAIVPAEKMKNYLQYSTKRGSAER
jgi:hypothetical protein